MKVYDSIKKVLSDASRDVKDRIFIMLAVTATVVSIVALIGDIIYGSNIIEIITLLATIVVIPALTWFGVRTDRIVLMAKILSFVLIFVVVPVAFMFGGGAEGTVISWLIFVYLYIGLMLSGALRVVALITHTAVVAGLFVYGYYYPVTYSLASRGSRYTDIALSGIEVGFICFIMTWFQNLMFANERILAREETRKVEELNKSQNRFFSSMSHEIRTPINSVLGLNEIILRQPDASEEILKDAANIRGAGRMLLALINDILDFSKIEAGKMDIVPTNYSIASMISEIVSMILPRAEEKGLEFNVELDPSIPSELYGDEVRIKQILINLLNNSVKYTREGSVTLHAEKENAGEGEVILIFTVVDTGLGIKQDAIPYLFDAFQRVDEGKNVGIEGTGLGLSIVKQLVELMGGTITVDSVYTQGSTFTVAVRQRIARADAVGSIDIKEYGNAGSSGEYKPGFTAEEARILIVDDNEMNLMVESKLLDGTKISIDLASGGEQALGMTLSEHYDVILMDHLMPEMDGIECLQHIRNQPGGLNNKVPVIALTANAGSEMKELYLSSGFEDYLVKPVTGKGMEEMLLAHLPASKVKLSDDQISGQVRRNTSSRYRRKLPVAVTCALTCDIPVPVLERHQIDTVCYTIISQNGQYYDGIEATSDELIRYIGEGVTFAAAPPTVEDYTDFFGKVLKRAHNVIYISGAEGLSPEYEFATKAAQTYGNVTVVDSGTSSAAVGMLVLLAQQLAIRGNTYEKIISELEIAKKCIHSCFVSDSVYYSNRNRFFDKFIVSLMKVLDLSLFISYSDKLFRVDRIARGSFDDYAAKFMDHVLDKAGKTNIDLIVVVYTKLDSRRKEMIRRYLSPRHVVFFRSSAVAPIYMGIGAFGMMCFEGGRYTGDILGMLDPLAIEDERDDYGSEGSTTDDTAAETTEDDANKPSVSIRDIPGIDYNVGITNSGNEETYRSLLEVYYNSITPNHDEICSYYDNEDWKNYTVKVHALKSSSLLIGAVTLSEEAKELEMAGKRDDIEYIRANHAGVMEHLKNLDPLIGAVFNAPVPEGADEPDMPDDDETYTGIDFGSIVTKSAFDTIREAALSHEDDVINATIEEIIDYPISMEDAEKFESLQMMLENGEYDKMISLIDG